MDPNTQPSQGYPQNAIAPGQEMVTPQQKDELLSVISTIRGKLKELETFGVMSDNKIEAMRIECLHEVLGLLQKDGVNLNDPNSVNQYIAKLKARNPEVAQQFEASMSELLGNDQEEPTQQVG